MIIERIKRKIKPNMYITPQTTPIVYFGNYEKAKACTISLNPSDREFLGKDGKLLMGKDARLYSRVDFSKLDNEELTDSDAIRVKESCEKYFDKNPFTAWFDLFAIPLKKYWNYSYYDGTCISLNLVQWATAQKFDINNNIWNDHINNDLPTLIYLLKKEFEVIFLNGQSVVDILSASLNIKLINKPISCKDTRGNDKGLIGYFGYHNNAKVIGWNLFYPTSFKTDNKDDLINRNNFWEAINKM